MKQHLERYRIRYDMWFSERRCTIPARWRTVQLLSENGYTYEKDGAVWQNTELGADKDESCAAQTASTPTTPPTSPTTATNSSRAGSTASSTSSAPTTTATWSASGDGDVPRPRHRPGQARFRHHADGAPRARRRGRQVSKRTGKALTLNDLLDEIGVDAYPLLLQRQPDAPWFDLGLAVRQDSENRLLRPVRPRASAA